MLRLILQAPNVRLARLDDRLDFSGLTNNGIRELNDQLFLIKGDRDERG